MAVSLARGSRARSFAIGAGVALLTILITQVVLPGSPGSGGRGTPLAILFTGTVLGLINSLTAVGLIVVYRTVRVVNFAQGAIGIIGARLVFDVVQFTDIPFVVVFPLGLALSGLAGVFFDIVLRRFSNSARLVVMVFTIAAAGLLGTIVPSIVRSIPIVPPTATVMESIGTESLRARLPFAGFDFRVGDFNFPFGFPEVLAIEVVVVLLLLVAAFFRFTKAGVALRAMAENTERAALLGVSVGSVTMTAFAIAGVLSGAGATLLGAVTTPGSATGIAPTVLVPALAAATVARFRSIPVAVVASLIIQLIARSVEHSFPNDLPLLNLGLFLVIGIGLFLQRSRTGRSESGAGVSWQATEEPRPVPKELSGIGTVRLGRIVAIALGLVVVLAYPFFTGTGNVVLGSGIALSAILTLSIVVLTGWAGQVSLGQFGFYAIGAVVGGALTGTVGLPFWFAVPLAAVFTAGFATLVGIPALRLPGLFLAVTTFAFSIAVASVLFQERYFGWLLPEAVERPSLLLFDFDEERSMYYLCVLALLLAVLVISNLRRSRFGRVLIAARENEANIQAFGINLVRTKLLAFAVSGGLCGYAGAIFAHLQRGLSDDAFSAQFSINLFVNAVLGGVSSIGGALLGSALFQAQQNFLQNNVIFQALAPVSAMLALYFVPGGIISLINRGRDGVLRIIAQRRQIVVPSLFADYDPEALERRLIPLSEASNLDGLAALPVAERFAYASELYAGTGERIVEKLGPAKQTKEALAIGAASQAVQEEPAVSREVEVGS